ncbi:SmdB family multidrug efflux ABC transporter permease/ATP-binding protein [Buchnera aphidicola]|uniref:SmdB family multidrug efflux ABC transporter permease/ATP-binding protein n=1 Tax=Buchnera aphidicola TaxID=9 RepID=UPI0031B7F5D5
MLFNTSHDLTRFWNILNRLLKYISIWKKQLIIAFLCLIIASITEVLGPILISYFIDNIVVSHNLNITLIVFIIIGFIMLQISSVTLNYYQTILFNKTAVKIVQNLRLDVIKSALQQPLYIFDTQPIGQIISRITNDTEIVKELYDTVIATVFRSIVLICVTLIAMFSLEWHMASIAIIIFPMVIMVMFFYQKYSTPILRKVKEYTENTNNQFNEIINGMQIIQQFNQEKKFKQCIKKNSKLHYLARMKILRLDGLLLRPLLSLFSAIILCGLIISCNIFSTHLFEIGVLYAFISYLGRLNEPLIAITTQQSILQQAIVSGERIFELIDTPNQIYGSDLLKLNSGSIEIKNLNFSYHNNTFYTLKNINLIIPSKGFTAFIGHTGSGKSTLANLLMGYYSFNQGKIYIDKRPIHSLSHQTLRKGVLMVQQEPLILADSILTNITLGRHISEKKIWQVLNMVQLTSLVQSMPQGIYSNLGEKGNNLSVGEKQLIAIARVFVVNPKILILDEATANIDSETEQNIQNALLSIRKFSTLVVIAHRLSTIIKADNIVVLHQGKIVEKGSHKILMQKKGYYWKMIKTQIKKY